MHITVIGVNAIDNDYYKIQIDYRDGSLIAIKSVLIFVNQ